MCFTLIRFLSTFGVSFLLLIVGTLSIIVLKPVQDETASYLPNFKFDRNEIPQYFTHITDLHITTINNRSKKNLEDAFSIFNEITPESVFITGDIVNTYSGHGRHCATKPNKPHFDLYQQIRDGIVKDKTKLYEVIGNHDTWGTLSWDTFIGKEALPETSYKYAASRVVGNIRLVSYNPMVPPITQGDMMNYWLTPEPITLDALETELEKETSAKYTIILLHQPTEMYLPPLESTISNRTLIQIFNDPKYHIIGLINGHTHPLETQFLKHKTFLECTLTCLKKFRTFGLVTVDNGQIGYTTLPLDNPFDHYAVISYPIPDRIALNTFSGENMQVRLISMTNEEKQYFVSIETEKGEIKGKLKRNTRINDNSWLYTFDIQENFEKGKHLLTISGDYNISMNFTVGMDLPGEKHYKKKPFNLEVFDSMIIAEVSFILISTLPSFFPDVLFSFFDKINIWMENGEKCNFLNLICSIICGPILIARRLKNQKTLTVIFLIITLLTFVLPVMYYEISGAPGKVWIYGYQIGDVYKEDVMARYYAVISLLFLVIPFIEITSLFYFNFLIVYILSLFVLFGEFRYAYNFYWKFGYNADNENWLKSPHFVYFPLLLTISSLTSFIIATIQRRKNKQLKKD